MGSGGETYENQHEEVVQKPETDEWDGVGDGD